MNVLEESDPMSKPIFIILAFLLLATLACTMLIPVSQGPSQQDLLATAVRLTSTAYAAPNLSQQDLISTAVAQTASAQLSAVVPPTQPPVVLATLPPPTLTAPPSETPTITPTSTPSIPMISVTVNTNCRLGPLPDYPNQGALVVGQKVELKGKNKSGDWWYIENPNKPGEFCWVWGQYAVIEGDVSSLEVIPSPPYFTIGFAGIHNCSGTYVAAFTVKNIGPTAFESGSITVVDTEVSGWPPFTPRIDNALFQPSTCGFGSPQSALAPNTSSTVAVGLVMGGTLPPTGHKMRADLQLCTKNDEAGTCVSRSLSFTMP
jgi:hypothetical protein